MLVEGLLRLDTFGEVAFEAEILCTINTIVMPPSFVSAQLRTGIPSACHATAGYECVAGR
jgi:hypothetical protein